MPIGIKAYFVRQLPAFEFFMMLDNEIMVL
jgi:hypothetical protein